MGKIVPWVLCSWISRQLWDIKKIAIMISSGTIILNKEIWFLAVWCHLPHIISSTISPIYCPILFKPHSPKVSCLPSATFLFFLHHIFALKYLGSPQFHELFIHGLWRVSVMVRGCHHSRKSKVLVLFSALNSEHLQGCLAAPLRLLSWCSAQFHLLGSPRCFRGGLETDLCSDRLSVLSTTFLSERD